MKKKLWEGMDAGDLALTLGVSMYHVRCWVCEGIPCRLVGGAQLPKFELLTAIAWLRDREERRKSRQIVIDVSVAAFQYLRGLGHA